MWSVWVALEHVHRAACARRARYARRLLQGCFCPHGCQILVLISWSPPGVPQFDLDNDGVLAARDIASALRSRGVQITDEQVRGRSVGEGCVA